jgi:hypothetical protein
MRVCISRHGSKREDVWQRKVIFYIGVVEQKTSYTDSNNKILYGLITSTDHGLTSIVHGLKNKK